MRNNRLLTISFFISLFLRRSPDILAGEASAVINYLLATYNSTEELFVMVDTLVLFFSFSVSFLVGRDADMAASS